MCKLPLKYTCLHYIAILFSYLFPSRVSVTQTYLQRLNTQHHYRNLTFLLTFWTIFTIRPPSAWTVLLLTPRVQWSHSFCTPLSCSNKRTIADLLVSTLESDKYIPRILFVEHNCLYAYICTSRLYYFVVPQTQTEPYKQILWQ